MQKLTLPILILLVSAIVPPGTICAYAQTTGQQNSTAGELPSEATYARSGEMIDGYGSDSRNAWNGRDFDYGGYERSPILFDPLDEDRRKRMYPQLGATYDYTREQSINNLCSKYQEYFPEAWCSQDGYDTTKGTNFTREYKTRTLSMTNLLVDDEIHKSEMFVFRPIHEIRQNFLEDEKQAEHYLDSFEKVRTISLMTLEFLDSEVSSALKSAWQQSDMDVVQQLLKQVAVNTSELASPDREQIFRDYHEKFEACMWSKGDASTLETANGEDRETPMFKHVNLGSCLDADSDCRKLHGKEDGSVSETALFHFCSCCAEKELNLNDSTVDKTEDAEGYSGLKPWDKNLCEEYIERMEGEAKGEGYGSGSFGYVNDVNTDDGELAEVTFSLVERTFMGLDYTPKDYSGKENASPKELRRLVSNYAHYFQDIYGDVCTYKTKQNFIRRIFVPPFWSVPQQVDVLRNGKPEQCDRPFMYCPITTEEVDYGICPAFKLIVSLDRKNLVGSIMREESGAVMTPDELRAIWTEATLGDPISSRDLQNINENFKDTSEMELFINTFCDTSAAVAFKKLHLRMRSIALDHLLINQKINESDRRVITKLMNRVAEYLGLAEEDRRSVADSALMASEVRRNRLDEANRAAFVASALGKSRNSAQLDELDAPFGGAAPSVLGTEP